MTLTDVPSPAAAAQSATAIRTEGNLLTTGSRIPSLDGLRAISISMVVTFHAINAFSFRRHRHDYEGLWSFFCNGPLGVGIFFVISGFLITHLLLREFNKTGSISLTQFYIRRTFRIWPAFFVYLAAVFILQRFGVLALKTSGIIAAATFTYNYVPRVGSSWIGQSWSLCVEEQFYFLWPLLLLLARPRRAIAIAIVLMALIPLIRLVESVLLPWVPPGATESYPSLLRTRMWMMGHTRMDSLMFGCLIALLANRAWFINVIRTLYRFKAQWFAVAYLAAGPMIWQWIRAHQAHLEEAIRDTTEGVCIAFLLAAAVLFHQDWFGRFLNWKPIVHLGQISYSLYLWHELFMVPQNTTWTGVFPLSLVCALILAELSRRFIEITFLAWRESWTKAHQRAT